MCTMNIQDIYKQNWKINKNININYARVPTIQKEEQELIINVLKCGIEDINKKEIYISCSFQEWITQLAKSEYFELSDVLVSDNPQNKGFILEIRGKLDYNGLTIRKKKRKFTTEELQQLKERMLKNNPKTKPN